MRFRRELFRGRSRQRVLAGLVVLGLALAYGTWSLGRFGHRGAERGAFDRPVVRLASRMVTAPGAQTSFSPSTDTELYLVAVITEQQDIVFGLTLLVMRLVAASTVGGLGLVLLTAGSTEWEVRSLAARADGDRLALDRP